MEREYFTTTHADCGQRLDARLKARYPDFSRSYFQSLIHEGALLVDGKSPKKAQKLEEGQCVDITFLITEDHTPIAEKIPLDILYEDEELMALNKQAGLVVHPAPGNWDGTLVSGLLHYVGSSLRCVPRCGIVHRLDKDTSGVILIAKNARIHHLLTEMFAMRDVKKRYVAITVGNPGTRRIEEPIGRASHDRKKMCVTNRGKDARSDVTLIRSYGELSHVTVDLHTGRTHQIRVHLREVNAPVLGDNVYGFEGTNQKYGVTRQLLHASCLQLRHPISGKQLYLEAALPEDIQKILRQVNKALV